MQIPVIRSEAPSFALLPTPWAISFLTSPATNANEARKRWDPKNDEHKRSFENVNAEIMSRRIRQVSRMGDVELKLCEIDARFGL